MRDSSKKRYFYLMMAIFGGISLSILVFFALFRLQGIGEVLHTIGSVLAPFVYGGVIAYLLRPMCNFYQSSFEEALPKKAKRYANPIAVALSLASLLLISYVLVMMMVPQLYSSIMTLWNGIPAKLNDVLLWANETFGENEQVMQVVNTLYDTANLEAQKWVENLQSYASSLMSIVSGVGTGVYKVLRVVYNLAIGLIVACYLLFSRRQFAKQSVLLVRSILNPKWANLFLNEVAYIDKMFGDFIDGKILDSAIIGLICYIGCIVFRFPNAMLISALVGITNVIPIFGPFIGAVPATFLIMIESPIKGLWFVVFVFALQQLDGNIIGPKILGDRTGLSSFWVLFAIVLFGGLFGVAGMLIGVPVFAVFYDIVKKLVRRSLIRSQQQEVWDAYKASYPDESKK